MADYTATGAGEAACNQDYTESGTQGGKPKYIGDTDSSWEIGFNDTYVAWEITDTLAGAPLQPSNKKYYKFDSGATPPVVQYDVGTGSAPGPTLAAAAGGGSAAKALACLGAGG